MLSLQADFRKLQWSGCPRRGPTGGANRHHTHTMRFCVVYITQGAYTGRFS